MKHLLLTTISAVVLVGCGPSIHDAVWDGNIEAVKQHIADGADVNAKAKGWTPLLYAAAALGDQKEIVKLLIASGADVNAKNEKGEAPLDWANDPNWPNDTAKTANLLRKHGGKTSTAVRRVEN